MGFPVRVKQAGRMELIVTLAVALPSLALLFYLSTFAPSYSWVSIAAWAFTVLEAVIIFFLARNVRRQLVIDDTSIRMLKDNSILWELPWERYGGYRIAFQGPIRTGIPAYVEFLDTSGHRVGKARLFEPGFVGFDQFRLMQTVKVLQERVPEGGITPPPVADKSLKGPVAIYWALAALGVFMFVFGMKMVQADGSHRDHRDSSPFSGYEGVMMAGSMLAGVFGGLASMSPRRSFRPLSPQNLEGFMAEHADTLSLDRLQPGKKYRYVDTGALRDNLNTYRRNAILILCDGGFLVGLVLYEIINLYNESHGPFPWMVRLWAPMFGFFAIMSIVITIPALRRVMACNKLRNSLGDQITISGDRLEVNRSGTLTSYPLLPKARKGPRLVLFGSQYLLFESGTNTYWLDPRFLVEV